MNAETFRQRYRLPEALGGGDYEGVVNGAFILLDVPGVGAVPFDPNVVTRVVPEEPESGSYVVIMPSDGGKPWVWSRHDDPLGETPNASHWWSHDQQQWCTWDQVWMRGIPRRLIFGGLIERTGGVKGLCSGCNKMRAMRVDGCISMHDSGGRRCSGANKKPVGGA